MSFFGAARAARSCQCVCRRMHTALALLLVMVFAGLCISCSNSKSTSRPILNAYVTMPATGSVLPLQVNRSTGAITLGIGTPQVQGSTPTGLALLPSKKFLYAANSSPADSISIFSVALDGSLTLHSTQPAGNGPEAAVFDPTGQYLLVTNVYGSNASGGDVSVYTVDAGSGALTEVTGSPFPANANPTQIVFTHNGKFVYVTNPGGHGLVTGFAFCPPALAPEPQCSGAKGMLTSVPGSPVFSGSGAGALTVDGGDQFLYVANPSASNLFPYAATVGNISGFQIDPNTGALTTILGSPFTSLNGSGPNAIVVDPTGQFVYAVTPGSAASIWCFRINLANGPTNGQLVEVIDSPFSLPAGGTFALFDPSGSFFYIGGQSGINVYTYDSTSGVPTAVTGSPFSTGMQPGRMVLSP